MEQEIEDKLEEIYKFTIYVKFQDFRKYYILCKVDNKKVFEIPILWNSKDTFEKNIYNIELKIDREILNYYKKGKK